MDRISVQFIITIMLFACSIGGGCEGGGIANYSVGGTMSGLSGKSTYGANVGSNNVAAFTIAADTGALTRIVAAAAAGIQSESFAVTGAIQ